MSLPQQDSLRCGEGDGRILERLLVFSVSHREPNLGKESYVMAENGLCLGIKMAWLLPSTLAGSIPYWTLIPSSFLEYLGQLTTSELPASFMSTPHHTSIGLMVMA